MYTEHACAATQVEAVPKAEPIAAEPIAGGGRGGRGGRGRGRGGRGRGRSGADDAPKKVCERPMFGAIPVCLCVV